MKIKICGVRGSLTTTDPATVLYGGNTSCIGVWENGWQLVLDGGSGIQKLKLDEKLAAKRIDILLTHLHLDHIQGLGFFKPLFDPEMEVHIWGPVSSSESLHARLRRYLSPPLFPVHIRDLPCQLELHEIEKSSFDIGPFSIMSDYVIHPGPTVGYRLSCNKGVVCYIPDHEPALGERGIINDSKWISGFDLAKGADLLIHDSQYTAKEYQLKKGWGHSSIDDAGFFASIADVKHVLYSHHDPYRTDKQVDEMFAEFTGRTEYPFKQEMAKEGMEIEL